MFKLRRVRRELAVEIFGFTIILKFPFRFQFQMTNKLTLDCVGMANSQQIHSLKLNKRQVNLSN